jgi:2-isopropylmalate synthase
MKRQIYFFDTTLRDGEQSPGISLNVQEKVEIAKQLARLGVDVIEAGFPIASPGDFAAVQSIAQQVEGPIITGLARALPQDIDRAYEALKDGKKIRIHTFVATSKIHLEYKLRKTPEQVLQMTSTAVQHAKSLVHDVEFSAEDATRSDPVFLSEVLAAAIEAGATVINVPDTVGYAVPGEFGRLIAYLMAHTPGIDQVILSVHCHNDLGLAVANTLAAMEQGARQVECTINGLGERAGNAALEELAMVLATRSDSYGVQTNIDTKHIYRSSRMVASLTGMNVQPNKAIVGDNAFAHESGIHQDGVLKERTTYEIMTPESIGLSQRRLVLGKHSGRHAFRARLAEMGYSLDEEEMETVFQRFIELADKKKGVSDRDIEAIIENEITEIPEVFQLEYLHVTGGHSAVPTATVRIRRNGVVAEEAACGGGPIDAVYKAIDRACNVAVQLAGYSLQAVTEGKDAIGEVVVRVEDTSGRTHLGRGMSIDIIEASAKAYVHALNKWAYEQSRFKENTVGRGE